MKNHEYKELTDKAIRLIREALQSDRELLEMFDRNIERDFRALPLHPDTILTLKGIIGYHIWCEQKDEKDTFLSNALHDITECSKNYLEPWFAPRLSKFVDYKRSHV